MHLHQIVMILAIMMAFMFGISWTSTQCKTVVMDVHMKMCKLGVNRAKRGLERLDLQMYDGKYESRRQEGSDYSKVNDSTSHGTPQRRHLLPSRRAPSIVVKTINGAAADRTYTVPRIEHYDPNPDLIVRSPSTFVRPRYHPLAPYPLGRGVTNFRVPTFNDALDFGLNEEELDELYNNIYERSSRASKEEAWKAFLETASKCCQNVDRCLKEMVRIPCLAG